MFSKLFAGSKSTEQNEAGYAYAQMWSVSKEVATELLEKYGIVPPCALVLTENDEIQSKYFGDEALDSTTFTDLLEQSVSYLEQQVSSGQVKAVALVSTLESEGNYAIATQVESAGHIKLDIYPYEQANDEWLVSEDPIGGEHGLLFDQQFPLFR